MAAEDSTDLSDNQEEAPSEETPLEEGTENVEPNSDAGGSSDPPSGAEMTGETDGGGTEESSSPDAESSMSDSPGGAGESVETDEDIPEESSSPVGGSEIEPEMIVEDEKEIRRELGIGGGKVELDQSEIQELLSGAVVGYEDVFEGTSLGDEGQPSMPGTPAADDRESLVDKNLDLLKDVHMKVKVELGRGHMYLKDILCLGQGSVVELERLAGDPLDIYVNDKVIARGEVLVLNENFCIRITEICTPEELLK